ncbi:hypothetical protein [Paraburkholderia sediminicola]|uniref:hypothetical protein n=1 Tax=Paraburkholderia sediminicola TaxID=458836 RepID=UPI0038BC29A8
MNAHSLRNTYPCLADHEIDQLRSSAKKFISYQMNFILIPVALLIENSSVMSSIDAAIAKYYRTTYVKAN